MSDPLDEAIFGSPARPDAPARDPREADHSLADHTLADDTERDNRDGREHRSRHSHEEPESRSRRDRATPTQPAVASRSGRRDEKPPTRGGRGRKWLVLLITLAVVGAAGLAAFTVLKPVLGKIPGFGSSSDVDYPGPGSGEVKIGVSDGQTGEDIATTLRDQGVTKTRTAYLEAAAGDPAAAARIQPGTYTLKKQMTGVDAFKVISNPANAVKNAVTLPEGLWASETFDRLAKASGIPVAEYQAAAKDAAGIGLPAVAGGNIEGWLSPTTYEFPEKSSAAQQLAIMVKRTVDEFAKLGVAPDQQQRLLTLASIVEGEVNAGTDRGKVARVVENRLDNPNGPTVGFLQMDSTRNYAIQKRGNLSASDVEKSKASPYDTYATKGLPPGPINNPSFASIEAAANPPAGNWYYFVTVNFDTGETLFAETLAEQEQNIGKWKQWCRDNPGKCDAK